MVINAGFLKIDSIASEYLLKGKAMTHKLATIYI